MGDIEKLTVCAINAVIAKGNDGMARTELIGLPHKVWRSNQRSRVTFQYRLAIDKFKNFKIQKTSI